MKALKRSILIAILGSSVAFQPAIGQESYDLISLYTKAESYDADIAAAKALLESEKAGESQALAGLLPKLDAQVTHEHTNSNGLGDAAPGMNPDDTYRSTNYLVRLTQPLVNFSSWQNLNSSELNSKRAEADYLLAQQNLIISVTSAYFGTLRTEENLRTAKAEETAVKRQYEQAREQFDVGLIAITDVHEAKAQFDSSRTRRIRAEGDVTVALEELARLTGEVVTSLKDLSSEFAIQLDPANSAEDWVNQAFENSLSIKSASFALASLKEQLKSSRSGHLPTLDLNASYSNTEFDNFRSGDQSEQSSIALVLNVPIYTGGSTQASVTQNRFLVEQAQHRLESAQRLAKINTRTEYINLKTNAQTVDSLQQNIISRESALEATREGYKVGTRNIVEVLDAERAYYSALRDYANARYDYVENTLSIRQAAGTLSVKDIEELNNFLTE